MKILIVDDDTFRTSSLQQFFISEKILSEEEIYIATNSQDAEDLLARFYFDVLVLDVVLPLNSIDKKPTSKNGIGILNSITRSNTSIRKPGKIIGITAHIADLGRFKKRFEDYCLIVIEANRLTVGWKTKLADYVRYDGAARAHGFLETEMLNIVTIHGIRTFGQWQLRLQRLVSAKVMELPFHTYKYGYFSFLAIFSRSRHSSEIRKLSGRLSEIFASNKGSSFILFSHSFGTYLIVEALRDITRLGGELPIRALVLSASVLPSSTDFTFLFERNIRIINECADSDYVLWISEALVPQLGMAGKTGLYGFENSLLTNRYFRGGHSSYFEGDDFMKDFWLPLLESADVAKFDTRESSALENDVFERLVITIGSIKALVVNAFRRAKNVLFNDREQSL